MINNKKPIYDSHSKLTLIIDGNWLLISRLAVLINKYPDIDSLIHNLKLLLIKSINAMLRSLPEVDNIIFVADGGSWRADIPIPEFLKKQGISYKGTREKSDDFDWDKLFGEFESFITDIKNYSNITVSCSYKIEGDDWCWWWSNILNNDNTNVIIWSADKDLTQLVKTNKETGVFTCTLYTRGKNTVVSIDERVSDDISFSMMLTNPLFVENSSILYEIINKATKINKINPSFVQLDKMFRGDGSDNILPPIKRITNAGKEFRLSVKQLDSSMNIWDNDIIHNFVDEVYNDKKFKNKTIVNEDIALEHLLYNRTLVALDEQSYPNDILKTMSEHNYYEKNKDLSVTEQHIKGETDELTSILDNI